jgi:predicted secreted Zn-dependent protease
MKPSVLLPLLLLAGVAQAKVTESIEFTTYDVDMAGARSMVRAIDAASPHRVEGKVVYGLTRYRVRWNYRYLQQPGGQCKLSALDVELAATVSMPRPVGASPKQEAKLAPVLEGLRIHELGHVDIGRQAAHAVDAAVGALPAQSTCDALKAAVDTTAKQAMAAFGERGAQYDADTGHGKTQGAWLYE